MKRCSRCKNVKSLDEFYLDRSRPDQRQRTCKSCFVLWHKSEAGQASLAKYRKSEKGLIAKKKGNTKYYASDKGRIERRAQAARWKKTNALKVQAHQALNNAVNWGRIERQPCEVCNSSKVEGHHEDYSQPLTVNWLCREHHVLKHKAKKELEHAKSQ